MGEMNLKGMCEKQGTGEPDADPFGFPNKRIVDYWSFAEVLPIGFFSIALQIYLC